MDNLLSIAPNPGLLWVSILVSTASWSLLLWLNWRWIADGGFARIFATLAGFHVFRFLGLVALLPQHVEPDAFGFSMTYLAQVGYGDLAANLLAIPAIIAVVRGWKTALPLAWAFIIVGTLDTINAGPKFALAITDQTQVGAMGWLILTVYVPVIVVTEILIIRALWRESFAPKPKLVFS